MGPGAALGELGEGCTWQRPLKRIGPEVGPRAFGRPAGLEGRGKQGGASQGVEVGVTPAGLCVGGL